MVDLMEIQKRILVNKKKKGFNTTDISKEFCFAYGEVSEAYEAWRNNKPDLGEEIADVVIYLLGLSEILNINLESEILKKMEKNESRVYYTIDGVLKKKDF